MPRSLRYDEIGYWSEIKLDIIKEYASAYSRIISSQRNPKFYHLYIDAFAGAGKHKSKGTGEFVQSILCKTFSANMQTGEEADGCKFCY